MFIRRSLRLVGISTLASMAVVVFTLSPAASIGTSVAPRIVQASVSAATAAAEPIVGQWSYQGGVVEVTGSDGNYVGRIVQATSFNNCTHPVGQQIWSIRGTGSRYSGTHIGFNLTDCSDLSMAATFVVTDNGSGQYSLRLCADAGCATLSRAADISAPVVTITKIPEGVVRIGKGFQYKFTVSDDSKKAKLSVALYSNGTLVKEASTKDYVDATGETYTQDVSAVNRYPGPFYLCMSAVDPSGNTTAKAPQSVCKWLSIQVPVGPIVANGCGGAGSPIPESVQHWLLDEQTYGKLTVDFKKACNVHDAGYAGATILDPFSGKVTDFRTKTRAQVDDLFRQNLMASCKAQMAGKNASFKNRYNCTDGVSLANAPVTYVFGNIPPGATAYWQGVRNYAQGAFDTDATVPGIQTVIPASTWPEGGGRDNA